jgi:hypothetical protein
MAQKHDPNCEHLHVMLDERARKALETYRLRLERLRGIRVSRSDAAREAILGAKT